LDPNKIKGKAHEIDLSKLDDKIFDKVKDGNHVSIRPKAQEKLEELANYSGPLTGGADVPQPPFTRDWTVSLDDPEIGLTSITVTVSWQRDEEQTVSLVTIVNQ